MLLTRSARLLCIAPRVVALLLLAAFPLAVLAEDLDAPQNDTAVNAPAATVTPPAPAEKAPKCYNGCLNWGQMCNVDPRGVYKCQRRCEKFGEICE